MRSLCAWGLCMACFLIYLMMSGWPGMVPPWSSPPPTAPQTGSVTVTAVQSIVQHHHHHFHLSDSRTGHIIDSTLEN